MRKFSTLYFFICAASLLSLNATARAQAERRYTVLILGKAAGVQTSSTRPDGAHVFTYEYNDRGRGPKLSSVIKLDPRGLPILVETTGNDYLKVPVNETLNVVSGMAKWKNGAESGEKLASKAFYVSMYGPPEEGALLAQALLKSPDKRLPLLPEGEASIRRTGELTVTAGGVSRRVVSYEVAGLGFSPSTIWLDEDNNFFGTVSSWTSFLPEGWESTQEPLLKKQDELEAKRTVNIAKTLVRKPTRPIAITNARLFDSETGKSVANTTVIVEGDRIRAVGRNVKIPAGAEVIDAKGKALIPGLWDMHVHIGPGDGLMHIAAGVTSVRDLANDTDALFSLKENIDDGNEIGPRVMMAGFMDGRGPYAGPTKVLVDTIEEGRAAIDNYARLGYVQIKIYSSINPELAPELIEYAHSKGLRVSGHVPAFMSAEQFVAAGADELQHINFFALNFLFDDVKDTRTPARFTAVAERAATIDLSSEKVRSLIKILRDKKIVVDPTVNIFEGMFTDRAGTISAGFASIADRLPPQVRRGLLTGGLAVPEGKDQRYRDSYKALLRMVKMLYDAGVPLVAGTDGMAGFTLHRELELYVEAGIPPAKVLQIATIGGARVMKRDLDLGSITTGKFADLVLLDGDPVKNISNIRRASLVMKGGKIYEPAALYRTIGVRP